MLHAVLYALGDSVNALLIGILVAIGIMLPRGRYRKIATLVVIGDWLGVVAAAAAVLFFLLGVRERIQHILESPVAGIVLIVVGIALGIGAWRSQGSPNELVRRLMEPLQRPSATTVGIGFAMGAIQSLTSVPFYYGLLHLAATDRPRRSTSGWRSTPRSRCRCRWCAGCLSRLCAPARTARPAAPLTPRAATPPASHCGAGWPSRSSW